MPHSSPRSLRHEYDLYVEQEIERYKDLVPRSVLLSIADEAVKALREQEQLQMDEMVLWTEVDRIIKERLGIPSYRSWRERRRRKLEKYRRPEHCGIYPTEALVRVIPSKADTHVLVAGAKAQQTALYLAANGCEVTALEREEEAVDRVMSAAAAVGLTRRVHGRVCDLGEWSPSLPLDAVICTPGAFQGLCQTELARVISLLQGATADGGVHLVETLVAGRTVVTLEELANRYAGWEISVERAVEAAGVFLARKGVS